MITLEELMALQRDLQTKMRPMGRDPGDIEDPEEKIDFIVYHKAALEAELQEALDEIGWKPWATSKHINREAYLSEIVDALFFWMNLALVVNASADELERIYRAKREKNISRQQGDYDNIVGKCAWCKRALDDNNVDCEAAVLGTSMAWCAQKAGPDEADGFFDLNDLKARHR